jgi:hypothetical protein
MWPIHCITDGADDEEKARHHHNERPLINCPKIVSVESISRKGATYIIDIKREASHESCCLTCSISMCSNNHL